jgi:hypothetical protein
MYVPAPPFAHRLDDCDDACAAERVKYRPHLQMRPCPASRAFLRY